MEAGSNCFGQGEEPCGGVNRDRKQTRRSTDPGRLGPAPFSCLLVFFAHSARKLGPPDGEQTSIHLEQSIGEAKLKTAHLVRYGSVFLTPTQLGHFANCTFHLGLETIFCEGIRSIAPLQLGGRNAISKTAQCANHHMHNDALPQ